MIPSDMALLFFRGLKVLLHHGAHYIENTFLNDGMSDLSEKTKKSVITAKGGGGFLKRSLVLKITEKYFFLDFIFKIT